MQTLDWLSKLISFDTTSRHSNLALIEGVKAWLDSQGVKTRLTYDADRKKANLLATLPAKDQTLQGGLLLSGHTDVVPVDGQAWDTNPFEAVKKDGRIYGRGACDMKGFLAVILALVPQLQKQALKKPVHLAFTYDEEVGCHGAPLLIADMQAASITPEACIVGEPSNMQAIIAHKGISLFRVSVHGVAAHSSLTPKGCNAIEYAAKLISYIRQLADELREKGPFDQHFDVPFTSMSVNRITGGIADNIIPELCEFILEVRQLPQVSSKTLLEKIKQYADQLEAKVDIHPIAAVPSFESHEDAIVYQLAKTMIKQNETRKVAYATEAGLFERAHIPTIIFGPGSITEAHRPNEYVSIEELIHCEAFLKELIRLYCG